MSKNIVLCSDGTGNSAGKARGTNVFKIYETVGVHRPQHHTAGAPPSPEQIAFYDDGVGTESLKWLSLLTGALGLGLGRNVRDLYTELVRSYQPGDHIYLFGFSRGAFTVRTLAGLVAMCGIVKAEQAEGDPARLHELVKQAYGLYRQQYAARLQRMLRLVPTQRERNASLRAFREEHAHPRQPIRFIGAWDTVDAVGLPFDHASEFINASIYQFKFPRRTINPKAVTTLRHALSVDDERHTFHPVLWREGRSARRADMRQVWFAGAHSNVGGGRPRQGMSLVTLSWMIEEAEAAGLYLDDARVKQYHTGQNVHDKLSDSRSGGAIYYRYKPRDIARLCRDQEAPVRIHESVFERIEQGTGGYAPGNVPFASELDVHVATPAVKGLHRRHEGGNQGGRSPLDSARSTVATREFTYYAFVFGTLLFVQQAVLSHLTWRRPADRSLLAAIGGMFTPTGVAQIAWAGAQEWSLAFVLIPAFYIAGDHLRRRLESGFGGYWSALRAGRPAPELMRTSGREPSHVGASLSVLGGTLILAVLGAAFWWGLLSAGPWGQVRDWAEASEQALTMPEMPPLSLEARADFFSALRGPASQCSASTVCTQYESGVLWDLPFPFWMGGAACLLIAFLISWGGLRSPRWPWLILLPIAFMVADWIEDVLLLTILSMDGSGTGLLRFALSATTTKLVFLGATALAVAVLVPAAVSSSARRRRLKRSMAAESPAVP